MWRHVVLFMLLANWAGAAEHLELHRRLETEAGVAWGKYLLMASHMRGEGSERRTDLKTGEVLDATDHVIFTSNGESG